jgi:polygalacturonase
MKCRNNLWAFGLLCLFAGFAGGCSSSESGSDAVSDDVGIVDADLDSVDVVGVDIPGGDVADLDVDVFEPVYCSVRGHGATGDGVTLDTAAIQAAIDECAGIGGIVVMEPGTYYSGSIFLKSRMTFRIEEGAKLLGSTVEADYTGQSLVVATGIDDVTLEGPGIIDGNGPDWWFWHMLNENAFRPERMVKFLDSRNITVRNLWMQQGAGWQLHFLACDNVLVDNLTIRTTVAEHAQSPNTDGIDIDGCRNVEVRNCDIETGDDAIVLKNGDATWARESYNINVHDCVVASWANALKIGTRPRAPIHDVVFRDCIVQAAVHSGVGIRAMGGLTLISDDGSEVYNILAENITMTGVQAPFFIRTQERLLDDEGDRVSEAGRLYGVMLRNIDVQDATLPGMIMGIPGHPVEDVTLENVTIKSSVGGTQADRDIVPEERNLEYPDSIYFGTMPAYGIYARHVSGPLTFAGSVDMESVVDEKRAAVILDDVQQLDLSGIGEGAEVIQVGL